MVVESAALLLGPQMGCFHVVHNAPNRTCEVDLELGRFQAAVDEHGGGAQHALVQAASRPAAQEAAVDLWSPVPGASAGRVHCLPHLQAQTNGRRTG